MDAMARLLELVARELEADDVRLELTWKPPAPHDLSVELTGGFRLTAVFAAPPPDAESRRARLEALAQTFSTTLTAGLARAPQPVTGTELASGALDETMIALAELSHAIAAVVIDDHSPVIWASSLQPRGPEDVDVAAWVSAAANTADRHGLAFAELVVGTRDALAQACASLPAEDGARLQRAATRLQQIGLQRSPAQWHAFVATMRAIASTRRGDAEVGEAHERVVRAFGGIYRVVLVCGPQSSALHAEATLIRALPVIEKQVAALPPFEPGPGGSGGGGGRGQVVRLFPPRS
ncbi:MAG: hypothetical protein KBB21_27540 [Nannocystaceae bacterium]|nr:hypothetical protein [Nannocystaceae bacterium]